MTPQRRLAACAPVALAAALALVAPSGAAPSPDPRAVTTGIAHELRTQERLPSEERVEPDSREPRGAPEPDASRSAFEAGAVAQILGWAALGFVAVVIAMWLAETVPVLRAKRGLTARAGRTRAAAGARREEARPVLGSAEELAAAGRYTEAIHQLLADALAALRARLDHPIPDALTSREILRGLALSPPQRDALRTIVERVEHTWFAQRPAAAEDFDAVRASYRSFVGGAP